jgi:hypothetical protein
MMARAYERDLELEELNRGEPPEEYHDCPECGGEGAIEVWESVSKWSIDPPSAHAVPCQACNGAGGFFCEAEGDHA